MVQTVMQSRMLRRRRDHPGALALRPAPREIEEGWEVFDGCEVGREAPDARFGDPQMTKTARHITLSPSRDIPFDKLLLSQSNVRKIKAGISVEELAEDIARRGLLQGLNVRPVLDETGTETGMFEIPAGGRRYQALALLVKQKRLAKTAPVPCVVRDPHSAIMAEDDSLAENVQRVALHPLDQFRAFVSLRSKGLTEDEIAAAFFVAPQVVKQRLRLAAAAAAPVLLEVYAEEGMTLEQLMPAPSIFSSSFATKMTSVMIHRSAALTSRCRMAPAAAPFGSMTMMRATSKTSSPSSSVWPKTLAFPAYGVSNTRSPVHGPVWMDLAAARMSLTSAPENPSAGRRRQSGWRSH